MHKEKEKFMIFCLNHSFENIKREKKRKVIINNCGHLNLTDFSFR